MSFSNHSGMYDPNRALVSVAQQSQGRAVLFLFQPLTRPFTDQAHRPLTYRMTEDIFNAAHEAAHRVNMGMPQRKAVDTVVNRSDTMAAIVPSFDPTVRIGLSNLSATWKFMLVINGDYTPPDQVSTWGRDNAGREIYFGYCLEEPINPMTLHMSQPTLNPDARLNITHKSVIQCYPAHSAQASIPRFVTMSDADLIDPLVATALSSAQLQVSDPLHLSQNADVTSGQGGVIYAIPQPAAANNLSNLITPVIVDTRMQNPQDNLATLMNAAILANGKLNSDQQFGRDNPFTSNLSRGDVVSESMESHFQSSTSTILHGNLRPDVPHTLGQICQRYHPEVFPYTSDRSVMFSPFDQSQRSLSTVFCSLLCSAIPPLLMQLQILHFAFQYESRSYDHNQPDAWMIHSVQSAVSMPNELLMQKTQAIMHTLKTGLFRMMLEAKGDFAVHGSFGAANVSHCYINFHCDRERMVDPFEVPTIFGGLTSSLLADTNTTFQNTAQYSLLLNAMTGSEMQDYVPEMRDAAPTYSVTGDRAALSAPPLIPHNLIRL